MVAFPAIAAVSAVAVVPAIASDTADHGVPSLVGIPAAVDILACCCCRFWRCGVPAVACITGVAGIPAVVGILEGFETEFLAFFCSMKGSEQNSERFSFAKWFGTEFRGIFSST